MLDSAPFTIEHGPYHQMSSASQSMQFPTVLRMEDAADMISDSPSSAPLLGVDGAGEPLSVDFDSDSPHVLISAASGGGKSVILRSITAQHLANGGVAAILDLKRHSHRWAKSLAPVCAYAHKLTDIGDYLVSVGKEVHRRNEIVDEYDGPIEDAPVGPRLLVVLEELNATMQQLSRLDRQLGKGQYTASDALRDIMFMGRAAKVHVVAVAQFATAQAMGGGDIRENFSTRILLRYTKQAWTMLAYDCGYPVSAPEEPGRGMVCRGGKARETQFLYLSEDEAKQLVLDSPAAQERARELAPRWKWRKHELTAR